MGWKPLPKTGYRRTVLVPRRAPFQHRSTPAVQSPAELKTQEVKTGLGGLVKSNQIRLFRRDFQSVLRQSLRQRLIKASRIALVFKRTDKVIGISTEIRRTLTLWFHDILKPHI